MSKEQMIDALREYMMLVSGIIDLVESDRALMPGRDPVETELYILSTELEQIRKLWDQRRK